MNENLTPAQRQKMAEDLAAMRALLGIPMGETPEDGGSE